MGLSVLTVVRGADVVVDGRVRGHDVRHVEAKARILEEHSRRTHSASASMS